MIHVIKILLFRYEEKRLKLKINKIERDVTKHWGC